MKVRYFKTAAAFRTWMKRHHVNRSDLWVGFYNRASGRGGLTYREALDVALCFGWIDGIRKKVDEASYTNRFTPRRAGSRWSAVNVKRLGELRDAGLVAPRGIKAFEAWDGNKAPYSFEHQPTQLSPELLERFRSDRRAWSFFSARPPGYRRIVSFWVMSAKKDETRLRRLEQLMARSRAAQKVL
jgi:uncharacterized protein YdeI (YjbR/CyaY-like superfamily)